MKILDVGIDKKIALDQTRNVKMDIKIAIEFIQGVQH